MAISTGTSTYILAPNAKDARPGVKLSKGKENPLIFAESLPPAYLHRKTEYWPRYMSGNWIRWTSSLSNSATSELNAAEIDNPDLDCSGYQS